MRRRIWIAVAIWAVTLVAGALVLLLANFGASAWVMVPCGIWLLTIGFPTTAAVLVAASLVDGWPIAVFVIAVCAPGLALQFLAVSWVIGKDLAREPQA